MLYLSIAIVIVAIIAGYLINKIIDREYPINTQSTENNVELSAAVSEMHKQFDARINKSFETIQVLKSELESLRLQVAIKRSS
jgi:uncharacterized membrane protein YraQ (UPF0718 family)